MKVGGHESGHTKTPSVDYFSRSHTGAASFVLPFEVLCLWADLAPSRLTRVLHSSDSKVRDGRSLSMNEGRQNIYKCEIYLHNPRVCCRIGYLKIPTIPVSLNAVRLLVSPPHFPVSLYSSLVSPSFFTDPFLTLLFRPSLPSLRKREGDLRRKK